MGKIYSFWKCLKTDVFLHTAKDRLAYHPDVCMYVCMYVYTCVVCKCIYVCMYVCMYVKLYLCMYVCLQDLCMYVRL